MQMPPMPPMPQFEGSGGGLDFLEEPSFGEKEEPKKKGLFGMFKK
jgi:hypothetical protein